MIARYTRPQMGQIWSDENKFGRWLEVEIAACEVLAEEGVVPAESARRIREKANFSIQRIDEIEQELKHNLIAFPSSVAEFVGPDSGSFHYGLTSSDIFDPALPFQPTRAF